MANDTFRPTAANQYSPGVDIGLSYRLMRDPLLGWHVVGVMLQNIVAPRMKSTGMEDEVYRGI